MKKQYICTACGFIGKPKRVAKGSIVIEIILWLLFIIPGFLYSIWRLTTKQKVCPSCKNPTMIPGDSHKGMELMAVKK